MKKILRLLMISGLLLSFSQFAIAKGAKVLTDVKTDLNGMDVTHEIFAYEKQITMKLNNLSGVAARCEAEFDLKAQSKERRKATIESGKSHTMVVRLGRTQTKININLTCYDAAAGAPEEGDKGAEQDEPSVDVSGSVGVEVSK